MDFLNRSLRSRNLFNQQVYLLSDVSVVELYTSRLLCQNYTRAGYCFRTIHAQATVLELYTRRLLF